MVGVSRLLTFKRIALSLAMLLAAVAVAGKLAAAASSEGPSASFTFNPTSPFTGEDISFNSTSSDDGVITQLDWNFGDGETATGAGATHAYPVPGIYEVQLAVTDDEGLTSTDLQAVAVQNREPNAEFHWTPDAPLKGETVLFTSDSTDPENRISAERWDLDGDGDFSDDTGSTASRSFAAGGSYTVSLRVEDQDGGTSTISKTVEVTDPPNQIPNADFTVSPASPTILENVTFTSESSDPDGTIASYAWDLDNDGQYNDSFDPETSRLFVLSGTYTIRLLVTDNEGGIDTATKTVTVGNPPNDPPSAAFHFSPTAPMVGETVTFTSDATDDGSVALEEWDFNGDGTYDAAGSQVEHTYGAADTYAVRLRVTDDQGVQDTASETVVVAEAPNEAPTASFNFTPSSPNANQAVTFTSTSTDDGAIASTEWDFSDDGTYDATGAEVQHSYAVPKSYTVRLRVTDDKGVSRETTRTVTVPNQQPTAGFTFSPAAPQKNQTVSFSSLATDPENRVQSITWDLDGDNQYDDASGITAEKAFGTTGDHVVRLKIQDLDGGSDTAAQTITIANLSPTASFAITPENPLSLVRVTFTSTSEDLDGTITEIRWDTDNDGSFDDGSDIEATRVFDTPGTKTVRLRVTDDSNKQVITTRTLTVTNRPPSAIIDAPSAAPKNTTVTFRSTSNDLDGSIASTQWDLDNDGQFDDSTSTQPTRSFNTTGPKTVRLRVTDNHGVVDEDTHVVEIGGNMAPVATFTVAPSSPLTLAPGVSFTSTSTDSDGSIMAIAWDLDGDGNFDDGVRSPISFQFPTPGEKTVRLRVTDNDGATDIEEKKVNLVNRAPTASVDMLPLSPMSLEQVTLTSIASDLDGTIQSQLWDLDGDSRFDDGTGPSIIHAFPKKGTYTVRVRVTDDFGATATGTRIVNVSNRLPIATFSHAPGSPNPREPVTVTSTSTDLDGTIAKFEWDTDNDGSFDDGTGISASRTFTTSGNKTVRLRVTDNDGGETIGSQTIVVGNRPPVAAFEYRPAVPIAGQQVTFFSTSDDPDKNVEHVDWDLDGNGTFETPGATAAGTYPAGNFNISVRVTDTEGSFAIATQTIVVSEPPAQVPQAPQISSQGPQLRLLSPFPIVRIAGQIGRRGTRFRVLSVDAPRGAKVTVRCTGRRCPFKTSTRATAVGQRLAYAARKVRIRQLERRLLRSGTVIRIYVTKPGSIGKYTSITVRRSKPPRRADRCLLPTNNRKPVRCPS